MHSVLDLKANRADAEAHQSLEQTLIQSCLRSLLAHDDWAKLAVVTHKDDVLRTFKNRDQSLWLRSLGRLVNQYLPESEVTDPAIKCSHTGGTDDISVA